MPGSGAPPAEPGGFLRLERLSRAFDGEAAVRDLSLSVGAREIVTILGPSGCGKTTTLRMVAGFETPDSGHVRLEGRDVTGQPPQRRGFGMVFQHYALFPHLSVAENVGFGLEGAGRPKAEVRDRIARALDLVGLPGFEDRAIGSLSGGQQQRIALARALAPEPRVLLLDEPLSNLDAALRERTRRELRALVKEIGITAVYVTHDQEEAFDLSDRIAVMRAGRLDQVGPAEELYRAPATEFVARFLGRAGPVEAEVGSVDGTSVGCRFSNGVVWSARSPETDRLAAGSRVRILCRPEALALTGTDADRALPGRVRHRRFAGSYYLYAVAVDGGELEVQAGSAAAEPGARVGVRPVGPPEGLHAFPVRPE